MERILLVEDDAALARGIALALDAHERTVTAAQTAAEARRAVTAERFDLVLLDINLPDASGLELLRVLVENRGHAVSRSDLIDRVWSEEAAFVEENALSVTVKRLRAKLERDPAHPQWLRTVRGIGYEWRREP